MKNYVFFKDYGWKNQIIFNSLKHIYPNIIGVVEEDEHILSANVISMAEFVLERIYGYSITCEQEQYIYTPFLITPNYVTICIETISTAVMFLDGKIRGRIWYQFPYDKLYVEKVEWFDESGKTLRVDFYNIYGKIFCSAYSNTDNELINKLYYDKNGKTILSYDYSTDSYLILENGCVKHSYLDKREIYSALFDSISEQDTVLFGDYELFLLYNSCQRDNKRDCFLVLNTEEDTEKYLKNMNESDGKLLYVDDSFIAKHIDKLLNHKSVVYQSRYQWDKYVNFTKDILILTRSDQIKNLSMTIEYFPELHFHIAARTLVSEYLSEYGSKYSNVTIYPCISDYKLHELLQRCSILLDISYGGEFPMGLALAIYNDLLIISYEDTIHNDTYISKECMFSSDSAKQLFEFIKEMERDSNYYTERIKKQKMHLCKQMK